jgi:ABC-type sugar transport system permease subunit
MSIAAPPPPTQAAIPRGIEIARVVSLANRPKVDLRMRITPYLFVTPYVIVTLTFFVYPLVYATILAFYQTNGPSRRVFVGLSNFSFVLSDPDFHKALWNTSIFAVCSILVQLPLSLGLAMLLSAKDDRLKSLFRLAIFAPNLVGQVFVGVLFVMLFTPRYGLFNIFLFKLVGWGLEEKWLSDPHLVMPAIVLASLWMYVGFNMIYFLAALQNVDQGLVEAARIDGAGPRTIFLHVTIPAIMPVATFVIVTFEVIWRLGWMDTYKALLIPGCVSAFGIFLFRQAIMQVPDDLLEAGRIDGCGEFRIYLSLVMPLVRPMSGITRLR